MSESNIYQYIPKTSQREENLFLEEYYSGTDTKIYIDNEEQSEISYISYSVNEQLKPIYGYQSMTWDAVAIGSRIVSGTLKITIKNPEKNNVLGNPETSINTNLDALTGNTIERENEKSQKKKEKQEWIQDNRENVLDFMNNLKNLNTNEELLNTQKKLNTLGYACEETGVLDKKTKKALDNFCKDNNLNTPSMITTTVSNAINTNLMFKESKNKQKTSNKQESIYYGPSEDYGIVKTIPQNTNMWIIKNIGDYSLVKLVTGEEGYILNSSLN